MIARRATIVVATLLASVCFPSWTSLVQPVADFFR